MIKEHSSRPIKAWVGTKRVYQDRGNGSIPVEVPDIEDSALQQLHNLATLPFLHPHGIAVMPDVHAGMGSTVGTVIATERAIIPAAVGVDIGCGMNAVRTCLTADQLPNLSQLRSMIEARIPLAGPSGHGSSTVHLTRQGMLLAEFFEHNIAAKYPKLVSKYVWAQMGTLGTGNHFIEICLDEDDCVWIVLHSGSRGQGNQIGRFFIEKAQRMMEQFFITLPHKDLAYLPDGTEEFADYVVAVNWAQEYALENRRRMMSEVLRILAKMTVGSESEGSLITADEAINCHHNYVALENHFSRNVYVTRKGAIRARAGDLGVIPGSMGAKSYIVRGVGNADSYCSCSHGAGRRMSRTEAKATFTVDDLIEQTIGVECNKTDAVLDEIPRAYKDIDMVMANQTDLVEIVHTLRQVVNVKGA